MISQLSPADFHTWRDHAATEAGGSLPVVLDVREAWELQTASVKPDGFTLVHIPMGEIPARIAELQDADGGNLPIACLCHHGMRSQQVAYFLAQNGFEEVVNLQGGIDAWSRQVDPSVPLY